MTEQTPSAAGTSGTDDDFSSWKPDLGLPASATDTDFSTWKPTLGGGSSTDWMSSTPVLRTPTLLSSAPAPIHTSPTPSSAPAPTNTAQPPGLEDATSSLKQAAIPDFDKALRDMEATRVRSRRGLDVLLEEAQREVDSVNRGASGAARGAALAGTAAAVFVTGTVVLLIMSIFSAGKSSGPPSIEGVAVSAKQQPSTSWIGPSDIAGEYTLHVDSPCNKVVYIDDDNERKSACVTRHDMDTVVVGQPFKATEATIPETTYQCGSQRDCADAQANLKVSNEAGKDGAAPKTTAKPTAPPGI